MPLITAPPVPGVKRGFTLVELSIVLIIIGLIVGGVLVGQDLVSGASLRGEIAQIQKYQSAVHAFQSKFNGSLPGDIPAIPAAKFGFAARGTARGNGDGNGVIESCGGFYGANESCGELAMFWVDLSTAQMIDGTFNTASSINPPSGTVTGTGLDAYLPRAKIGKGNYVYVWSGGIGNATGSDADSADNGLNYFGISVPSSINSYGFTSTPGLTVQQASVIDKKIDDGLPQSGSVLALYDTWNIPWYGSIGWAAGGGSVFGASTTDGTYSPTTAATPYASTNCYDNNNVTGPQTYSISQNANALNCALSFEFQ